MCSLEPGGLAAKTKTALPLIHRQLNSSVVWKTAFREEEELTGMGRR